jgi:hypothetical protein
MAMAHAIPNIRPYNALFCSGAIVLSSLSQSYSNVLFT